MVIAQEPAQPLAALHRFLTMRLRDPTEQQDVRLPLMIPLSMVMRNIFAQRPPQRTFTKENELVVRSLCNVARGWVGSCVITIKKLRELAGKSRPMAVRLRPGRAYAKADILLMTMTAGKLTSW